MEWYLGLDLDQNEIQISMMRIEDREPESVAQEKDSGRFRIPTCLAQKITSGVWCFGEEAAMHAKDPDYIFLDDLYERAILGQKIMVGEERIDAGMAFGLFLQKVVQMLVQRHRNMEIVQVTIAVRKITPAILGFMEIIPSYLKLPAEAVHLRDYKECFYHYALSGDAMLHSHDVLLFDYTGHDLKCMHLTVDKRKQPLLAIIHEETFENFDFTVFGKPMTSEEKDEEFVHILKEVLAGKVISAVYLVGEGFAGEWMEESTRLLCQNRRVFVGQNLYTKGAAWSMINPIVGDWPYVYLGDEKTKANLAIMIRDGRKDKLYTLVSAGENWYETSGDADVILTEGEILPIVLKAPDGSATKMEELPLTGLPLRPPKTTRLHVEARPEAQDVIRVKITDLGFGALTPGSGLTWEYRVTI